MSNRRSADLSIETENHRNMYRSHINDADLANNANQQLDAKSINNNQKSNRKSNRNKKNAAPETPQKPGQLKNNALGANNAPAPGSAYARFGIPMPNKNKGGKNKNLNANQGSFDSVMTPSTMAPSSRSSPSSSPMPSTFHKMWDQMIPEQERELSGNVGYGYEKSPKNYHVTTRRQNKLRARAAKNRAEKGLDFRHVNEYEKNWLRAQETNEGASDPFWSTQFDWSISGNVPVQFAEIGKRSDYFDSIYYNIDWSVQGQLPKQYNDVVNSQEYDCNFDWSAANAVPYGERYGDWEFWDYPSVDWTSNKQNVFDKENNWTLDSPTFKQQFDENPIAIDWSVENELPDVFSVGSKRKSGKSSSDTLNDVDQEDFVADWSNSKRLPVQFKYWDYDLMLDWSSVGAPPGLELIQKAEHKAEHKASKWDPLVLDWGADGISDKITHAPWKKLFPFTCEKKEFILSIDWSKNGMPKVFKKMSFNHNEKRAQKYAKKKEILDNIEKIDFSNTESIWKLLDNPDANFNAELNLENNEPVKIGNFEIQLGKNESKRMVSKLYNNGNIAQTLDWSENGLPTGIKKNAPLFDKDVVFDWSEGGMPHLFNVGQKREPVPNIELLLERCCSDLFNEVTNYKLVEGYKNIHKRDYQIFDAIDWGSGVPIKESKLWDNVSRFCDWSVRGLPKMLYDAQWSPKYGVNYVELRKARNKGISSDLVLNLDHLTQFDAKTRVDLRQDMMRAFEDGQQQDSRMNSREGITRKTDIAFPFSPSQQSVGGSSYRNSKPKASKIYTSSVNLNNDHKAAYAINSPLRRPSTAKPTVERGGSLRKFNPVEYRVKNRQMAKRPAKQGCGIKLFNKSEASYKLKIAEKNGDLTTNLAVYSPKSAKNAPPRNKRSMTRDQIIAAQRAEFAANYTPIPKGRGLQKFNKVNARVRNNNRLFPKQKLAPVRDAKYSPTQLSWEKQATSMNANKFNARSVQTQNQFRTYGPKNSRPQPYTPANYHVKIDGTKNKIRPKGYVPIREKMATKMATTHKIMNDYEIAWLQAQENEPESNFFNDHAEFLQIDWSASGVPRAFGFYGYENPRRSPPAYHLCIRPRDNKMRRVAARRGYIPVRDRMRKQLCRRPIMNDYEKAWLAQQENEAGGNLAFDWSGNGVPDLFRSYNMAAVPFSTLGGNPNSKSFFDAAYFHSLTPTSQNKMSWGGAAFGSHFAPSPANYHLSFGPSKIRPAGFTPIREKLANKLCNRKIMNSYEKCWLQMQEVDEDDQRLDKFWDRGVDFSGSGMPGIYGSVAEERAKFRAWQKNKNSEELRIDWANCAKNQLPTEFRQLTRGFWADFDAASIDWSVNGLPKEIWEKLPGSKVGFLQDLMAFDWSGAGIPEPIKKVANDNSLNNKSLKGLTKSEKTACFFSNPGVVDWSAEGVPSLISNCANANHELDRMRCSGNRCPEQIVIDFSATGAPINNLQNWHVPKGSYIEAGNFLDWSVSGIPYDFGKNTYFDEDNLGGVLDWSSAGLPEFLNTVNSVGNSRKKLREHPKQEQCFWNWNKSGVANMRQLFRFDKELEQCDWSANGVNGLSGNLYVNPSSVFSQPANGSFPLGSSGKIKKPRSSDWQIPRNDRRFWTIINKADAAGDCGAIDWSQTGIPSEDPVKFFGAKHGKTMKKFLAMRPKNASFIDNFDPGCESVFSNSGNKRVQFCYEKPIDWSYAGIPYQLKMGGEKDSYGMSKANWEANWCNIDWSADGVDGRVAGKSLFDGRQLDWSLDGVHNVFHIGERNTAFEELFALTDWSVDGQLPFSFESVYNPRNLEHGHEHSFDAVDWSGDKTLPSVGEAEFEGSWDWSCKGLPLAGAKNSYSTFQNKYMHNAFFACDWSADGTPLAFLNQSFFEKDAIKNYDPNLNFTRRQLVSPNNQKNSSRTPFAMQFAYDSSDLACLGRSEANIKPENFKHIRNSPDSQANSRKDRYREARYLNRTARSKHTKRNLRHLMVTEAKSYQQNQRKQRDKAQKVWRHQQIMEKEMKNNVFTFDIVPNELNITLEYEPRTTEEANRARDSPRTIFEHAIQIPSSSSSLQHQLINLNTNINENIFSPTAKSEQKEYVSNKQAYLPVINLPRISSRQRNSGDHSASEVVSASDFSNNQNNVGLHKKNGSDASSWMLLSDQDYGYSVGGSRSSMSASSRN